MELDTLLDEARDLFDETVALRRTLHRWPELGNDLPVTREHVLGALEGLPLQLTLHETTSGIAAVLDGGKPGPTVLLRGDMDALPLHEDTDLEFESADEGKMHACGHDTHTAMLVGAAKLLSARREKQKLVHSVNFNDLDSVRWVCERYPIAVLLTEPILQNIGIVKPRPGYLEGLRRLAAEMGFDEA